MKRLFLAIAIVFLVSTVFAVDPPGTKVPLQLVVGSGKTKTVIDSTELKRIKQIDEKVSTADLVELEVMDTLNITAKATAPTKSVGTNTPDIATMAAVQAENEAWSSGFLNFTGNVGMPVVWASYMLQHSLTDGFLKIVAVKVTKPCTATGVEWIQSVAGDYTADNYNGVVLFSISGTTYTKIAESTNDGNIWKATSNTVGSKAFSSPVVLVPGVYYIGIVYNQSAVNTAPQIAHNDFFSAFQSFTGSNNFCQRVAASTVSASYTLANFSVNNEQPFVTLY